MPLGHVNVESCITEDIQNMSKLFLAIRNTGGRVVWGVILLFWAGLVDDT